MPGISDPKNGVFSSPVMASSGETRKRLRIDPHASPDVLQGGDGHMVPPVWSAVGTHLAMDQQVNIRWCDGTFQRIHKVISLTM